jgi:ABC-2 type transport system permease protein
VRFAHPGAALRVELAKLGQQLTIRALLAVCLLGPIGFALVMRVQSTVPADTLFGRWARTTGFATSLTILSFATTFGLPLVAGVLAGDVFSSEDRHDTWKTVLTRSVTRADVFLGKTLATFLYAALLIVALGASSLVSAVLLVGSDPLVGLTGQLVPAGRATWLVLLSWAYTLLPLLVFAALGLLLSLASRSAIVGVLGPGLVGLVLQLLALVGSGEIERALLPGTPLDAWHGLFTAPAHVEPLVQGAITCLVYVAILLILAWYVLQRRAFAAAEAVSQRRWRVPVRAAVVSAVVLAALVLVAGLGPTTLTSSRLEGSITPTFERLVSLQYEWRTHSLAPAGRPVEVRTSCRRSSGAKTGPGEDWTCQVLVLRPKLQPISNGTTGTTAANNTLTLDVSVKSNGCYTADGPPAVIGPAILTDDRGKTFVNPLATFDGCFGTA